jgi:hypothetical protein
MANVNDGRSVAPSDANGKSEADLQATKAPTNGDVGTPTNKATSDKEAVTTRQVYETKDGTPVEASTIPSKEPFGPEPDVSSRDDVVAITEGIDEDGNVVSREKA